MLTKPLSLKRNYRQVKQNIRNIGVNFLCSFLMLVIVGLISLSSNLLTSLSSSLAAFLLLLTYLSIIGGLICFYLLTTQYNTGLTILSFLLNFVFWTTELVGLEDHFHNSYLYQEENASAIFILALGTFLWTFNKIVLDLIFLLFRPKLQETRLDKFVKKRNTTIITRP